MFQWLTVLETLGYILIFPGFLFCFLVGLFLSGVDRKIVARMQKRVGPPLLQPFYDFFKLCGKETIVPAAASRTTFLTAPLVGLAALVVIQLFIPIHGFSAFAGMADVIVVLYLLLIPALAAILGARSRNVTDVTSNLNEAIKLDSTLAARAARDLEFELYKKQVAEILK